MSQLSLSWKTFRNNVCDGLSSFQQKGEFVDMTLAADGHFVKVHQMVISLASPYLKELIKSAPCPHPVLFLNNVSYQSLCSILEYIYSGEAVVNKDDIGDFIQAGKALHIKGLEVMESTNVHVVGGTGSQVTVTTDQEKIIDKMPRRKQAESDQIPQFQVENQSHNISNQELHPNVELNTSYMDEHMEDSFQENIESDDNTNLQNKTSNHDKSPSVQYTLSNQGNIQMILNRYLYNLRYVYKNSNPPARMWRCAEYVKNRCPASVTTEDDVVVQRKAAHKHSFHDKRILKKARSGIILTAIKDAEHKGKLLKKETDTCEIKKAAKNTDTSNDTLIKIRVSKDKSDPLSD